MNRRPILYGVAAAAASALLLAGCSGPEHGAAPPQVAHTGSPARGAQLISSYGCASCHTIPGIADAHGLVGPPLTQFARRSYIAGMLPNTEANLHRWLENPQAIVPGNAMPNLHVTARDAADITAYLYTLR